MRRTAVSARLGCLLLVCAGIAGAARAAPAGEFEAALSFYRRARYGEARRIFERLAAERPEDPELDFYLGRLALWFDDGTEALTRLERAAQRDPASARVQNALGDAFGFAAQHANLLAKFSWAMKCKAAYERAVAVEPGNCDYRWSLLGYYLVAPRLAGGGMELARAQAEAIKKIDPMNGRIAAATVCLGEKKFAAAFAEFDEVLRRSPDDYLALYQVGRCAALSGEQIDRGIAALRRCLGLPAPAGEGTPGAAEVHYRLAELLDKKGDTAGARAEYAESARENPDFRPAKVALRK